MEENKNNTQTTAEETNTQTTAISRPIDGLAGYNSIVAAGGTPDKETAKKLYNILNGDCQKLGDYIGKQIVVKDIIAEGVSFVNEETGEVEDSVKLTFIDPAGVAYVTYSRGILNSLRNLFNVFGRPHEWEEPLTVEIKQVTRGKFKSLTLFVV